jgi:hypothetical protein
MLTLLIDTGTLIIAASETGGCVTVEQAGSQDVQP